MLIGHTSTFKNAIGETIMAALNIIDYSLSGIIFLRQNVANHHNEEYKVNAWLKRAI